MKKSSSNQSNTMELAKRGDAKSIGILLNRQLNPKGINAKISAKEKGLNIMLEATQSLPQERMVGLVQKLIAGLDLNIIFASVRIYGRQISEDLPDWTEILQLDSGLFTTEYPNDVLNQFLNLKARTSIGVSYVDFPPILGTANQVVQNFKRSVDNTVSPYCSTLIEKVMLYYQISLESLGLKVQRTSTVSALTFGLGGSLTGIASSEDLGIKISTEIPSLEKSRLTGLYDFDSILTVFWNKAWELTDELDRVLSDQAEFLRIRDKDFGENHEWTIAQIQENSIIQSVNSQSNRESLDVYKATQEKNKRVAAAMAITMGCLGIHKFYLGYVKEGLILLSIGSLVIYVFPNLFLILLIFGLTEGIIYLRKSDADFKKTYLDNKKSWF